MKQFGFKVKIRFKKDSPFKETSITCHNITEIHYNYDSICPWKSVAFESDIHKTGLTQRINDIEEFEATNETKKCKEF